MGFIVLFVLTGVGNGSTYKMIPSIFALLGRDDAELKGYDLRTPRSSSNAERPP